MSDEGMYQGGEPAASQEPEIPAAPAGTVGSAHLLGSSAVDDRHRLASAQADAQHQLPPPAPPSADEQGRRAPQPGNLRLIAAIALIALIVIALVGIVPKVLENRQIDNNARQQVSDGTAVQYINPSAPAKYQDISLPGNIEAVQQSAINARATGYVQQILVDIGDKVVQGQTLAVIEAPDVEQELSQARAQLSGSLANLAQSRAGVVAQLGNLAQAQANLIRSVASLAQARQTLAQSQAQLAQARQAAAQQDANLVQAQANLHLASVTNTRYQNLVKQGAVDQETADQQYANYQTNLANVQALQAALSASQANIVAYQDAVYANRANVDAFQSGVTASRAAVATAQANVDSSRAVVNASAADVSSNSANVQHYEVLVGFNTVTAPFSGVITARNIDLGDLVNAGSSNNGGSIGSSSAGTSTESGAASGNGGIGTSSTVTSSSSGSSASQSGSGSASSLTAGLFSEAKLALMHVYVNIPQAYAYQVAPGVKARLSVASVPGQHFTGVVTRTAGALDPSSRTLVAEVRVPNPQQILKPGMFTMVSFHLPSGGEGLMVPDTAIVTNSQNTQVVVVTQQNTLHFVPITILRDFGSASLVQSTLNMSDKIVDNPTDSMQEGQAVSSATAEPTQLQQHGS